MINPSDFSGMVHDGLELYLADNLAFAKKRAQEMQHEVSNYPTESAIKDRASLEEIKGYLEADEKKVAYYDDAFVNRETWLASQTADAFSYWSIEKIDIDPRQASKAICDYAVMLFKVAKLWKNDGVQKRRKLYDQINPNLRRYVRDTIPVDVEGMYGQMSVIWNNFEQSNHTNNQISCEDTIVTAIMCSLYSGK
jgi:hypothetical protein